MGAVHAIVAHPSDADILYIGAVNGGVWRTNNATSANPDWTPLTDFESSLSIGALELDPTDTDHQTIVAGIGQFASFPAGGAREGLLKSTDGGNSWVELDGGGTLDGKNIAGVAPRGNTIVVAVNSSGVGDAGIFRSTDGGASFAQISGGDGMATGLPNGRTFDLASDPSDNRVLYTAVADADRAGGENGIYKSVDMGGSWSKVSDAGIDAIFNDTTNNVELSVGGGGEVYAAVLNYGQPEGIFRSTLGQGHWQRMDTPATNENGSEVGTNPGSQGRIHFSIRAHPSNPHLVFVGGDRQPCGYGTCFPNSIGANDFSGRLFRGDSSQPSGSQFVHLTHSDSLGAAGGGTASGSSPHSDSRDMAFDAGGDLIDVNDGGVYRRTSPTDNSGDWFSLNGNLQVTELHSVGYDSLNHRMVGGAYDNGTPLQEGGLGDLSWIGISPGAGGDVAVDTTSQPGVSIVYSSFQNLGAFRKSTYDAAGNLIDESFPLLTPLSDASPIAGQYTTPIELNRVDPTRIVFAGHNGVYESHDQGETVSLVSPMTAKAMVYGGQSSGNANADLLYFGASDEVFVRTTSSGDVATAAGYHGDDVRDLDISNSDYNSVFVIDSNAVYFSSDTGNEFANVSGNLAANDLRTIEYVDLPGGGADAILVGGREGVFFSLTHALGIWNELGQATLPNAPVFDLLYDATDDLLIAATIGRGAWSYADASQALIPEQSSIALAIAAAAVLLQARKRRCRHDLVRH